MAYASGQDICPATNIMIILLYNRAVKEKLSLVSNRPRNQASQQISAVLNRPV